MGPGPGRGGKNGEDQKKRKEEKLIRENMKLKARGWRRRQLGMCSSRGERKRVIAVALKKEENKYFCVPAVIKSQTTTNIRDKPG